MQPHARPTAGVPATDRLSAGLAPPSGAGAQAYEYTINVDGPEASAQLGAVRHELAVWLQGHPRCGDACLVVTELLTNGLVHGTSRGGIVRVRIVRTRDDWLTVDVTDSGQTADAACSGAGLGLGLVIVRTLAHRYCTCASPDGGRRVRLLLSPQTSAHASAVNGPGQHHDR